MARKIAVEIIGDSRDLERKLKRSSGAVKKFSGDVSKVGKGRKALDSVKGSALGMAAGFVGFSALSEGVKKAVSDSSDLNEEIGKNKVVFKGSSREIEDWSKTTANALGISQAEALKATGTFGNMLVPMGVGRDKAADMSKTMVNLAGDMASFNNASPEDTLDALRSGLAGESEPLRRFGSDIRDSALQQFALSRGMKTAVKDMTSQQKQQLIYKKILSDTKDAQGDAARTGNNWAGVQRRLGALVENLSAKLGTTLLPALTNAANAVADWLGKTENQKAIMDAVTGAVKILKTAVSTLKTAFNFLSKAMGGNENAVKALIAMYAGFKVLSIANKVTTLATNVGGLTSKLKKSKAAAGGLRGSLIGKAGLAGAALGVGILVGTMIRNLTPLGDYLDSLAAKLADLSTANEFTGHKFAKPASSSLMQRARREAGTLERAGATPQQAATFLMRAHPMKFALRDAEVLAGVTGARPTTHYNIQNLNVHGVPNVQALEEALIRRNRRRPHRRRGS